MNIVETITDDFFLNNEIEEKLAMPHGIAEAELVPHPERKRGYPRMNNLEIMAEVRARLARNFVSFSRKPGKWKNVVAHPKAQIEAVIGDLMVSIPTFRSDYVYAGVPFPVELFSYTFRKGENIDRRDDDQLVLFLLKHRDNLYLVNTEGHDYARYIMRLSDDDWKL